MALRVRATLRNRRVKPAVHALNTFAYLLRPQNTEISCEADVRCNLASPASSHCYAALSINPADIFEGDVVLYSLPTDDEFHQYGRTVLRGREALDNRHDIGLVSLKEPYGSNWMVWRWRQHSTTQLGEATHQVFSNRSGLVSTKSKRISIPTG
jgi:hypothetical protein